MRGKIGGCGACGSQIGDRAAFDRAAAAELRVVQQRLGLSVGGDRLGDLAVPGQPAGAGQHEPRIVSRRTGQREHAPQRVVTTDRGGVAV